MAANKLNTTYINKGKTIIIPTVWIPPLRKENGIVLNLPERSIYLFKDYKVINVYPCAVGAPGRWQTPTGSYKIAIKTIDPVWLPPEWAGIDHPVMPGPDNPLGDRWMGLSRPGYGLHATNAPNSIGSAVSHGCVRMYPENARKLYNQVKVGMPVEIVYETVKLGFSVNTGKYYISVFPDIYYYGTNSFPVIIEKLTRLGLEKLVEEDVILKALKEKRGIPQPIIGSDYAIKFNNELISLPMSPVIKDGQILVPVDLFKGLGFEITYDEDTKLILLANGFDSFTNILNSNKGLFNGNLINLKYESLKAGNSIIVPLSLIKDFKFDYKIIGDRIVITKPQEENTDETENTDRHPETKTPQVKHSDGE
jgi:L,D-transpeptidase ErfK/SrfK